MKITNRPSVSVCMASYNGAAFINEQIDSILSQISTNDELIIIDDCSSDETVELIENYKDPRIRLYVNSCNVGHVKSFEYAIMRATREYIQLADQDDIWVLNRLNIMLDAAASNKTLIIGAFNNFTSSLALRKESLTSYTQTSKYRVLFDLFLGKLPILGCVMCFPSEHVKALLPFPNFVYAHDIYIFQFFFMKNRFHFMADNVLYHRIHDFNVTPKRRRSLLVVIYSRILMLFTFIVLRHK